MFFHSDWGWGKRNILIDTLDSNFFFSVIFFLPSPHDGLPYFCNLRLVAHRVLPHVVFKIQVVLAHVFLFILLLLFLKN